jgi:hypothetical protein
MSKEDNFYVGYLPFPRGLRRGYLIAIPVLIVLSIGIALGLASNQQPAGEGSWQVAKTSAVTGRLSVDPYPIVHTVDGESVLLVIQGKRGATDAAASFAGQMVTVTGFDVRRGSWQMLEIPALGAFVAAPEAVVVTIPEAQALGVDSLLGEIVDSKCFLGVMKPGAGKVHRSCASLCLLGGMPPMLVVNTEEGRYGYVIINGDGSSAARQLAGQVAIPVKLTGEFERRGDLMYIRLPSTGRGVEPLTGTLLTSYGDSLAVDPAVPAFCGVMPGPIAAT